MHLRNLISIPTVVLITLASPLQAQLVQKESPVSTGKAKGSAHAKKVRSLSDFGISPRALWSEKRVGEKDDLTFRFATLTRKEETDHGKSLYDVFGRDAFSETGGKVSLGQIRIGEDGPEFSKRSGGPWTTGEKDDDAWLFALDQTTIRVEPMDEEFSPSSFKVLAFERGIDVKAGRTLFESQRAAPIYHSAVVAFAFGRNEFAGTIKYPGNTFVVSFQGVKFKGHWVGRSTSMGPFNIIVNRPVGSSTETGARLPDTGNSFTTQIDLDDHRLLVGVGPLLNYALVGDPSDRLSTACAFDLDMGQALADLADRYRDNRSRSTWAKGDEEQSFSREAEKAYAALGRKIWLWAPLEGRVFQSWKDQAKTFLDTLRDRVKSFGGSVGLLDFDGNPIPDRAASIQEGPQASMRPASSIQVPAFPLAALRVTDHLVTIHISGEVRFWSPDRTKFEPKNILGLGEMLTSGEASPDGTGFVTTGNAGVRQWDGGSGQAVRILPMDGCKGYWCAAYSPDGKLVAAGGNDGRTRIWDARTGALIGSTKVGGWGISFSASRERPKPEFVSSLAFSPDAKRLAEGTASGEFRIWDLTNPASPKKSKTGDLGKGFGKVYRLRFLHGGSELLALDQAGSFQILDCQSWQVSRKSDAVLPTTTSVVFSPADDWVVSAHEGGRIVKTDLASGSIASDRQADGVVIGTLATENGKVFILGNQSWKPVNL